MRSFATWGLGWCAGAIILLLLAVDAMRARPLAAVVFVAAGVAAFGIPTHRATRRDGSARARAQAMVWVIGFAVAGLLLWDRYLAETGLAPPGALNINTTETMQARQASFDRWGMEPEAVSSVIFTLAIVTGFGFASATLSSLLGSGFGGRRILRATLFGLISAAAVVAGCAVLPIAGYLLTIILSLGTIGPLKGLSLPGGFVLATLMAGGSAGAIIDRARPGGAVRE